MKLADAILLAWTKVATKFGIVRQHGEYRRTLDNSARYARQSCEGSLRRLGIEQIDLYYVHRLDPAHPVDETMAGLAQLVQEGKIARIGLCEVSEATLRRAHAVQPVTAVQSEYSLWYRGPEAELLPLLDELGIGLVPFSPLGAGFLTGQIGRDTTFAKGDFRNDVPRFAPEARDANLALVDLIAAVARDKGATPAQVALAWLLAQRPWIAPIPGTTKLHRLEENLGALDVALSAAELSRIDAAASQLNLEGARLPAASLAMTDK